jgi:hypothetical protein
MSSKLARKYEAAWNQLFYEEEEWKQKIIIANPHGRHAGELAAQTMRLAERGKLTPMERSLGALELQMPASGEQI